MILIPLLLIALFLRQIVVLLEEIASKSEVNISVLHPTQEPVFDEERFNQILETKLKQAIQHERKPGGSLR